MAYREIYKYNKKEEDHSHKYYDDYVINIIFVFIVRALSKLVGQHPDTLDDYLDAVMFGLRTKKQTTPKCSPYYLMFGREARYPSEVPEHYMVVFSYIFIFQSFFLSLSLYLCI